MVYIGVESAVYLEGKLMNFFVKSLTRVFVLVGIIFFSLSAGGQEESSILEKPRWWIAGFDSKNQVVKLIEKFRLFLANEDLSLISEINPRFPFAFNCFENDNLQQNGLFWVESPELFLETWKFLIKKDERFSDLKKLQFEDLSFNSNGASSPRGLLWFTPIITESKEEIIMYSVNTNESCLNLKSEIHN